LVFRGPVDVGDARGSKALGARFFSLLTSMRLEVSENLPVIQRGFD